VPAIQWAKSIETMLSRAKVRIKKALGLEFIRLECMLIEVGDIRELRKLFDWDRVAVLDDPAARPGGG